MANIIAGFTIIALGILGILAWPWRVVEVLEGLIPIVFICVGIVAVAAGMEITKENAAKAEKEDAK